MSEINAKKTYVYTKPVQVSAGSSQDIRDNFQALYQGDLLPLRPRAQDTPDMTIQIASAVCDTYYQQVYFGTDGSTFAGASTIVMTTPTVNPRLDLVSLSSIGDLTITQGSENVSPVAPVCPANEIPICLVYHRITEDTIVNYEDSVASTLEGYIYKDIRPFLNIEESDNVKLMGNQSIDGVKTFTSLPLLPASNPTTDNEAVRKAYADTKVAYTDTRFKVGTFSYNVATTGTQAINGVGFQPKAVIFLSTISGSSKVSWGLDDVSTADSIAINANDGHYYNSGAIGDVASISLCTVGSNVTIATAKITATGSDGFTITKSKSGSPTGTATVIYVAFR
jgi:hypothetical protein